MASSKINDLIDMFVTATLNRHNLPVEKTNKCVAMAVGLLYETEAIAILPATFQNVVSFVTIAVQNGANFDPWEVSDLINQWSKVVEAAQTENEKIALFMGEVNTYFHTPNDGKIASSQIRTIQPTTVWGIICLSGFVVRR